MAVVSIRPAGLAELRMALVIALNLILRKINYVPGLCIQMEFKFFWTALLLNIVEVNKPAGLNKIMVNFVTALSIGSKKAGFAQKMRLQKVFNFSRMALLLLT
jgi:hypothetical protein